MITEQDVFNYIFYPNLVEEKKKILINSSQEYGYLLQFYRKIKTDSEKTISNEVKHNLSLRINLYKHSRFFRLKKIDEDPPKRRKSEYPLLAAASEEDDQSVTAKSFLDPANKYLIRVIKIKDKIKIYSFSADEKEIRNFKLKIFPSGKEFPMEDNSRPLELNEDIEIEEVQLELA